MIQAGGEVADCLVVDLGMESIDFPNHECIVLSIIKFLQAIQGQQRRG